MYAMHKKHREQNARDDVRRKQEGHIDSCTEGGGEDEGEGE